jgi:predicted nucleic acid-binding protein
MIIVDTSVWVEFLRQSDKNINDLMHAYLEDGEVVALSAIFGELLQGAKNESEEKVILEFWKAIPKISETELFIEAGRLSYKSKLISKGVGLIDCYILAAAKNHRLNLWTLDKKLLKAYNSL